MRVIKFLLRPVKKLLFAVKVTVGIVLFIMVAAFAWLFENDEPQKPGDGYGI